MLKTAVGLLLALFVLPALPGAPQQTESTSLVVRIEPEARIDPQQVELHFRVSPGGGSDVIMQVAVVAAWVRATPGHQIRAIARLMNLNGPAGPIPANAVRWTGAVLNASAGAQGAACSSGVFTPDTAHDLVQGWDRSGKLTCMVNFELSARDLPPGEYSGLVGLALGQR